MHRRFRRLTAPLAAALILLASGTGVASADATTEAQQALAEDAALITTTQGSTVTPEQLSEEAAFSAFADQIAADYPDVYSDAFMHPSHGYVITFKSRYPSEIRTKVAALPYRVNLRTTGQATEADMLVAQQAAVESLEQEGKASTSTVVFDAPENTMSVTYTASSTEAATVESAVTEAIEASASEDGIPPADVVDVQFDVVSQPASSTESAGGVALYTKAGTLPCTSAFGYKLITGGAGLLGANHCYDQIYYNKKYPMSRGEAVLKKYGDVRLLGQSTADPATSAFFHDKGKVRYVTGAVSLKPGAQVCNFGIGTNKAQCAKVYKTGVCSSGWCNLVATDPYITAGGNSGGPWYIGTNAVGVHSGRGVIYGFNRSVYTPISAISTIGAQLLIKK